MARRSLQASAEGIQAIKKALKAQKWSQTYLAAHVGCSRQTIWSLLQGKPVDVDVFTEVCQQLSLNWEAVAELKQEAMTGSSELACKDDSTINELVQEFRVRIKPYILERCGIMRVLDMERPIKLADIYTSVNILERITGRRSLDISELMQNADPEQFDRFCLGKLREKRVPGIEAVEKFSKLMVLGKPGAGKTTFLKHLAIQCIGGEFQSDRVPIFITLKDFTGADDKPNLFTYIERLMAMPNVGAKHLENIFLSNTGSDRSNASSLNIIMHAGKALLLLDGLDEVREVDKGRVLQQIREFSQQFYSNQFIITCRTAAREYIFEQFTEVEIADFDYQQAAEFVNKWFESKNELNKAELFFQELKKIKPFQELVSSPILLTLLCLVFESLSGFPRNYAELYENSIDILLKKWDARRGIERDQVYKQLSSKRKEDLLSQIAFATFESGNYFFKEREVKTYVNQYIQNLFSNDDSLEPWDLDSNAMLKSIEAQHGLIVERARGIYSFSHLTLHEYFASRYIVTSSNPFTSDDCVLQNLIQHVTDQRWQQIFLLTSSILESADTLLFLMKSKIDGLVSENSKIQDFLKHLSYRSSDKGKFLCKPTAIRAYFLAHDLENNPTIVTFCGSNLATKIDLRINLVLESLQISSDETNELNWQFTHEEEELLQQYYYANTLLVDCLNSDCYVSQEVRQEIEETLLLPVAEIEKRKQQ
jgi:predicted NACHT family NTPase